MVNMYYGKKGGQRNEKKKKMDYGLQYFRLKRNSGKCRKMGNMHHGRKEGQRKGKKRGHRKGEKGGQEKM